PIIEVRASAGDNYLGGEDFTQLLLNDALTRWQLDAGSMSGKDLSSLLEHLEAAKCRGQSPLVCQWRYQEKEWNISWHDDELEALWSPLLNRLRAPIEQALRDSLLAPEQIDSLVLVGGASQHALVQRISVRLFGKM